MQQQSFNVWKMLLEERVETEFMVLQTTPNICQGLASLTLPLLLAFTIDYTNHLDEN